MDEVIAPYHRLGRARPEWWRPIIEIGLMAGLAFVFGVIFSVGMLLGPASETSISDVLFGSEDANTDPAMSALLFGGIAVGLPAIWLAARVVGRPRGTLWSVERRFRWRLFGQAVALIALPAFALLVLDVALFGVPLPIDRAFWQHVAIACTLVPLQCITEELMFRGMLPQAMGVWVRSAWLAYLVPLPIFVLGHPYGVSGLISVAIFGAMASLLTHRTGGLEAGIVLHITLNITVYFSEFSGIVEDFGVRQLLSVLMTFTMYGGAGILLLMRINTTVAPPELGSVHIRSLPHPSGELLGARGIDVVGPDGVVLNHMPWRGDTAEAELTVPGLHFRFTALHGRFSLRCRNTSKTPRQVYLAVVPHFAHGRLEGHLLYDAHRTVSLNPTGANDFVVWYPPEGGVCAGPALRDTILSPGQSVQTQLHIEVH